MTYLFGFLEQEEGRHGGDVVMLSNIFSLINVDFDENNVLHVLGPFLDLKYTI
ncbi:Thioredoxin [Caligus rogercresseyi]|uniref:Thioredoxin n=1 Tax=Caligus rogercresseyi TaxID=217165 RepID=A0A7T8GZF9_CALRO|nr:Thioredoxin [Caligus rogercresseyi]